MKASNTVDGDHRDNSPIQSPGIPMLGLHCSEGGLPAIAAGSSGMGTASEEAVA